jgi:hypothetical protein
MKGADAENLRQVLEWLGAQLLMIEPHDKIEISHVMAKEIVAILSSLPPGKAGRPKQWTHETEIRAVLRMVDGTPVKQLAREIAKETGQPKTSAERRLRALKKSPRFTNWKRG